MGELAVVAYAAAGPLAAVAVIASLLWTAHRRKRR